MSDFAPSSDRPPSRADMLAAFDEAIADDRLEFHYQPIFGTGDRRVVGVEALMRCPDGRGGHLATADLVAVLDDDGTAALARASVRNAIAQRRDWERHGLPVRISVNLLQEQVAADAFAGWLLAEVTAAGCAPADLALEIADNRPIVAGSAAEAGIRRLAAAGFPLTLDSFGRGHSNLAHMRDLSFRMLKSDRIFGTRLHAEDGRLMLEAMSGFSRALDFDMIVVGIESAAAAANAATLNAAAVQGFHFAPPMSADECTDWLSAHLASAAQRPAAAGPTLRG